MLANGLLRLIIAVFGILEWIGLIRLGVFVFGTVGIRFFLLAIKWIWFGRFNARQEERREK
jgi:phage-related minor tail protein